MLDLDPKPTGEDKKELFSWKKKGGYVELRDCRTFVTLEKDEAWAVGSVLRGFEKEDGSNDWKLVALIDFGKNDEEIVLTEVPLKGGPAEAHGRLRDSDDAPPVGPAARTLPTPKTAC